MFIVFAVVKRYRRCRCRDFKLIASRKIKVVSRRSNNDTHKPKNNNKSKCASNEIIAPRISEIKINKNKTQTGQEDKKKKEFNLIDKKKGDWD